MRCSSSGTKRAGNQNGCIIQGITAQPPRQESWGLGAGYVIHERSITSKEEPRDYRENLEVNIKFDMLNKYFCHATQVWDLTESASQHSRENMRVGAVSICDGRCVWCLFISLSSKHRKRLGPIAGLLSRPVLQQPISSGTFHKLPDQHQQLGNKYTNT